MNTRSDQFRAVLLSYRGEPNSKTFNAVVKNMRPYLSHCLKRGGYLTTLSDQQIHDIVDESMIVVDRQIRDYRWICSDCRATFATETEWTAHQQVHPVAPLKPIEVVVKTKAKFWAMSRATSIIRFGIRNTKASNSGMGDCGILSGVAISSNIELRIDLQRALARWGFTLSQIVDGELPSSVQRKVRRTIRALVEGTDL